MYQRNQLDKERKIRNEIEEYSENGDLESIKEYEREFPNIVSKAWDSILYYAASKNKTNVVEYALSKRAFNIAALEAAVENYNDDLAFLLAKAGVFDIEQSRALVLSLRYGLKETAAYLLQQGFDFSNLDLYSEVIPNSTEFLPLLYEKGVPITGDYGGYALFRSLNENDFPAFKFLVDHGANINFESYAYGWSVLEESVRKTDDPRFFNLLIQNNVKPDNKALKEAIAISDVERVKKLIDIGSVPTPETVAIAANKSKDIQNLMHYFIVKVCGIQDKNISYVEPRRGLYVFCINDGQRHYIVNDAIPNETFICPHCHQKISI